MDPRVLAMEADPRFAQLSYADQQHLREELLRMDPRFSQLNRREQYQVAAVVRGRAPVFQDPQRWMPLIEEERNQPPKPDIPRQAPPPGGPQAFQGASSILQASSLVKPAAWLVKKLGERLGVEALEQPWETVFSRDAEKMNAYLSQRSPELRALRTAGAVVGNVADIMSFSKTANMAMAATMGHKALASFPKMAGVLRKTAAAYAPTMGEKAAKQAARTILRDYAKFINLPKQIIGDVAYKGGVGAIRSALVEIGQKGLPEGSEETREFAFKALKGFGIWGGSELAYWLAVGVLPLFGKVAKLPADARKGIEGATGIEFRPPPMPPPGSTDLIAVQNLIDKAVSFKVVDPATVQRLSPALREMILQASDRAALMRNIGELRPTQKEQLFWLLRGFDYDPGKGALKSVLAPEAELTFPRDTMVELLGEATLNPGTRLDDPEQIQAMVEGFKQFQGQPPTPGVRFKVQVPEEVKLPLRKEDTKQSVNKIMEWLRDRGPVITTPYDSALGAMGEPQTASSSMVGHAIYRMLQMGALPDAGDLPGEAKVEDFIEAVQLFRDEGWMDLAGKVAEKPNQLETWWHYSPEREALSWASYLSQRDHWRGNWDEVTVRAKELGKIPTQYKDVKLAIPLSARNYATYAEADKLVEEGWGKRAHWEGTSEQMQAVYEAGRPPPMGFGVMSLQLGKGDPNVVVQYNNPLPMKAFSQARATVKKNYPELSDAQVDREVMSLAHGYDAILDEKAGRVIPFYPREQVKFISDRVNPYTDKFDVKQPLASRELAATQAARYRSVMVARTASGRLPETETGWPEELAARLLFPPDRNMTEARAIEYLRNYLKGLPGVANEDIPKVLEGVKVVVSDPETGLYPGLKEAFGEGAVIVPTKVTTEEAKLDTLRKLLTAVHEAAQPYLKEPLPAKTLGKGLKRFHKAQRRFGYFPDAYLDDLVVKKLGGMVHREGSRVRVNLGGDEIVYENPDEYVKAVVSAAATPKMIAQNLHDYYGMILKEAKIKRYNPETGEPEEVSGLQVRGRTADPGHRGEKGRFAQLYVGENIQDVVGWLMDTSWWKPVFPSSMSPKAFVLEPRPEGGVDVTFDTNLNLVRASRYDRLLSFMNSFVREQKKGEPSKLPLGKKGFIQLDGETRKWTAVNYATGDRLTFNSPEEARKWLAGGYREWDALRTGLAMRGWQVEEVLRDGTAVVRTSDGMAKINLKEDAEKLMSQLPIPEWARAVEPPMPSDVEAQIRGLINTPPPQSVPPAKPPRETAFGALRAEMLTTRNALLKLSRETANTKALEFFDTWLPNVQARHQDDLGNEELIKEMFKGTEGRAYDEMLEGAFRYRMALSPESKEGVIKRYELDKAWVQETMGLWDKFFEAMAQKYNVDLETLIREGYAPLMQGERMEVGAGARPTSLKAEEGPRIPSELKNYHLFERMEQQLQEENILDPRVVFRRYARSLSSAMYLGSMVDEYHALLKDKTVDDHSLDFLRRNIRAMLGMPVSRFEQQLRDGTKKYLTKIGQWSPTMGKAVETAIESIKLLPYLAFMGLRPWQQVFRNLTQPFLNGPLAGIPLHEIARGFAEELASLGKGVKYIEQTGMVPKHIPVGMGSEFDPDSLISKVGGIGMFGLTRSDHFDRAVFLRIAQRIIPKALQKRGQKGDWAGLRKDLFYDSEDDAAWTRLAELIRKGQVTGAIQEWTTMKNSHINYDYGAGFKAGPVTKSYLGKLWGVLGTWSHGRLSLLWHAATTGPKPTRAKNYLMGFLAASAMYVAFREVFGIDAKNFLMYNPATFIHTGGPQLNLIWRMVMSAGQGYQARQARGEVLGMASQMFLPGSAFIRDLTRAKELMDEGHTLHGVVRAMGAPVNSDGTLLGLWGQEKIGLGQYLGITR